MISSNDCKAAIVAYLKTKPGYVAAQFVDAPTKEDIAAFESYAHLEKNWKRFEKENQKDGLIRRGFDCKPFDDQLRAYTWDDGNKILKISVEGE